jgi:DNA mismatch endonuclease (patch repair protein)
MTDRVTSVVRSRMMAAVRGKDTAPERTVRAALFAAGYRYRLHRRDLPGVPDITLPRYRTAVFVHGCFWHGHKCPRGRGPSSNIEFWNAKLKGNRIRDIRNQARLRAEGWNVVIIWECSLATGCRRLLRGLEAKRQECRRDGASELTR